MKLPITTRALWALAIVGLCVPFLSISARLMSTGFETFTQTYLRIGVGFLITYIILHKNIHYHKIKSLSRHDWLMLFIMGVFGYGFVVIFATLGVLHAKLLNVAIIGSTTPFFIILFSVIFLKKRIHELHFFFLLTSFYGVCVLATKSFLPVFNHFGIGEIYLLLFAAGMGIYIEGRKFLSKKLNNSEITITVMLIAFVTSLTCALISGEKLHLSGFLNPIALSGLFLGGFLNFAVTELQNFGYQYLNAVVGSQLLLIQNIFAPILGFIFYHEHILAIEFFGAWCILMGIILHHHFAED